ncbi:MAG: RDD family protein, partial [Clostridiales bacterium]|nr:RDD family protein [Clostridiales bacterium]
MENSVYDVHPWPRFFARLIDYSIISFIIYVILEAIPAAEKFRGLIQFTGFVPVFVWIFFEAVLLSAWGSTPGKWLMNISVRAPDGSRLRLSEALERSFSVWFGGMGLGIPIFTLILSLRAFIELTERGWTRWDGRRGFSVTSGVHQTGRIIAAVL